VDERGEISGKCSDLGSYSVVLKGCSKGEGINLLLRTMAPSAIFTDEIGNEEDERAIQKSINAGVKIVCTAHGYDEKDVCRRRALKTLLDEKVFERVIVLESEGKIGSVKKVIGG
jgi:stage III sporulation protein AA